MVEVDDLLCKQLDRIEDRTESNGKAIGELQKDVAAIKGRNYATTDQVSAMSRVFDIAIEAHQKECRSNPPRTTITPSVPIRKFDGKVRIDIVQLAKLLAWIATIVGAAFGVDFVIH